MLPRLPVVQIPCLSLRIGASRAQLSWDKDEIYRDQELFGRRSINLASFVRHLRQPFALCTCCSAFGRFSLSFGNVVLC